MINTLNNIDIRKKIQSLEAPFGEILSFYENEKSHD